MTRNLHEKMRQEMATKYIFKQAQTYAFDYADKVCQRNVFPTDQASC